MNRFVPTCLLIAAVAILPAMATGAPPNRKLAEQFYQVAKAAKTPEEAIAAARRAIGYDPKHLSANLLLAERLLDKAQVGPAGEQLGKLGALLKADPTPPPDAKAKLASLKKRLQALRPQAGKWAALKATFAERYIALAEAPVPPGLPSTALAFGRAAALDPENDQVAEQARRAKASVPKVPTPAEKPDPAGAKLLCEQARRQMRAYRYDEAGGLLTSVVALDPANAEAWCDLGLCCLKCKVKNAPLAAACLLRAKEKLGAVTDPATAERLEVRINNLLRQADPRMQRLEELDRQLATAARHLAGQAADAGDKPTAAEIAACLKSVPLPSAPGARATPSGPGNLAGKVRLDAPSVKLTERLVKVTRSGNQVVLTPRPDPDRPTYSIQMSVQLGKLTFSGDSRFRWRVERLRADPGKMCGMAITCWALGNWHYWSLQEHRGRRSWGIGQAGNRTGGMPGDGYRYTLADAQDRRKAFREDGAYEVCFEKVGQRLRVWVDSLRLLEVELNGKQMAEAAKQPVCLRVMQWTNLSKGGGQAQFYPMKLTLQEMLLGKNLAPWKPPATQPDRVPARAS